MTKTKTVNERIQTEDDLKNDEGAQRAQDKATVAKATTAEERGKLDTDQTVEEWLHSIEQTIDQMLLINEIDAYARPGSDSGQEIEREPDRAIIATQWLFRAALQTVKGQVHGRRLPDGRFMNGTRENVNYWTDIAAKRLQSDPDSADPDTVDAFKRQKLAEMSHFEVALPVEAMLERMFEVVVGHTFEEDLELRGVTPPQDQKKADASAAMEKLKALTA